jgi:hypothetical protein
MEGGVDRLIDQEILGREGEGVDAGDASGDGFRPEGLRLHVEWIIGIEQLGVELEKEIGFLVVIVEFVGVGEGFDPIFPGFEVDPAESRVGFREVGRLYQDVDVAHDPEAEIAVDRLGQIAALEDDDRDTGFGEGAEGQAEVMEALEVHRGVAHIGAAEVFEDGGGDFACIGGRIRSIGFLNGAELVKEVRREAVAAGLIRNRGPFVGRVRGQDMLRMNRIRGLSNLAPNSNYRLRF